jgi:hypothetical protein
LNDLLYGGLKMLSFSPQKLNDEWWYYEEKKGIEIIHPIWSEDRIYIGTHSVIIPWRKIEMSLKRKNKSL